MKAAECRSRQRFCYTILYIIIRLYSQHCEGADGSGLRWASSCTGYWEHLESVTVKVVCQNAVEIKYTNLTKLFTRAMTLRSIGVSSYCDCRFSEDGIYEFATSLENIYCHIIPQIIQV